MAADTFEITGSLYETPEEAEALRLWFETASTGEEYGRWLSLHRQVLAGLWGVVVNWSDLRSGESTEQPLDDLQRLALSIADEHSHVAADRTVVHLTDNLVADVRTTTGLTYKDIADVYGITERAVAGWKQAGVVPRHRRALLQALRAIGLVLIGGLGADGVATWLLAGEPSRLARLAAEDFDAVVEEARAYQFSPAT